MREQDADHWNIAPLLDHSVWATRLRESATRRIEAAVIVDRLALEI
jgi:hypothetical protein